MIGDRFSNMKHITWNVKRNSGQALLITIMLIAVALTVVLAMSYTSKTDVQLSKLEEENQKALAAAEAGIDALVNQNAGASVLIDSSLDDSFKEFSGSATKTAVAQKEFASPLLQPKTQYSLYLSSYPTFTSPFNGSITFYYSTKPSCTDASADAIEISVVSGSSYPYTITRYLADGGNRIVSGLTEYLSSGNYTIDGTKYTCKSKPISISSSVNPKMVFVKSIFNPTRIGFEGSTNLPVQGTVINSEAKTSSGVSKKVQLFQSYPQIPADFFTTSF